MLVWAAVSGQPPSRGPITVTVHVACRGSHTPPLRPLPPVICDTVRHRASVTVSTRRKNYTNTTTTDRRNNKPSFQAGKCQTEADCSAVRPVNESERQRRQVKLKVPTVLFIIKGTLHQQLVSCCCSVHSGGACTQIWFTAQHFRGKHCALHTTTFIWYPADNY